MATLPLTLALVATTGSLCAQPLHPEYAPVDQAYDETMPTCLRDSLSVEACRQALDDRCTKEGPMGETTLGYAICASIGAAAWNRALERVVPRVSADLPDSVRDAFRVEQAAWVAYREAACAREVATYPGGSMQRYVGLYCDLWMTSDRVGELLDDIANPPN